jgi:hypothetical protein
MLYAAYYFFFKTKMYGVFQTCFYFGQMLVTCVAIGIVCGTMGYIGARSPFFSFFPFFFVFQVLVTCVAVDRGTMGYLGARSRCFSFFFRVWFQA